MSTKPTQLPILNIDFAIENKTQTQQTKQSDKDKSFIKKETPRSPKTELRV